MLGPSHRYSFSPLQSRPTHTSITVGKSHLLRRCSLLLTHIPPFIFPLYYIILYPPRPETSSRDNLHTSTFRNKMWPRARDPQRHVSQSKKEGQCAQLLCVKLVFWKPEYMFTFGGSSLFCTIPRRFVGRIRKRNKKYPRKKLPFTFCILSKLARKYLHIAMFSKFSNSESPPPPAPAESAGAEVI